VSWLAIFNKELLMLSRIRICFPLTLLLVCLVAYGITVQAQEADTTTSELQDDQSGEESLVADGKELVSQARQLQDELADLNKSYLRASGEDKSIFWNQIRNKRSALGKNVEQLIAHSEKLEDAGQDAAQERRFTRELLSTLSTDLTDSINASQKNITRLREQRSTATAEELETLDKQLEELANAVDEDLAAYLKLTLLMQEQGLDVRKQFQFLDSKVKERAENLSGVLQFLTAERAAIASTSPTATEEEKQSQATELAALDVRIKEMAAHMNATVAIMKDRELETAAYTQLLIESTGELTEDIFQTEVALGLLQGWLESGRDWVVDNGPRWIFKIIVFLLILLAFKFLAGIVKRLVRKAIDTSKVDFSQLLQNQLVSFSGKVVMFLGLLVALSQLGIQLAPVLAGLGIAGFIVGFALQDTLSNFASGMMILVYRPFDVGDAVEAGGVMGTVKAMNLVSTTITTWDNQKLVVPNSKIWGDVIRNITSEPNRRVDMTFGIAYADDIEHAERVLEDILKSNELVLADPEPVIRLHALGESSVDFIVRPWARTSDYWNVYWAVTRAVKQRFDAEGISIPFPQRDVHLIQEKPATG
jgi:small conductance mechanosensitive channel